MINTDELKEKIWWSYLEEDLQELLRTSVLLIHRVPSWKEKFHDYSFVVFSASKAYEGFLKKIFFDAGFISESEYSGKRFRIGKALNPSLDRKRYKNESVYDKIVEHCGGEELARTLWDVWKNSRNLLFHWFPMEKRAITFDEAIQRVDSILQGIDAAYRECKLK